MSYQVIARKWRPQTFADVVGSSTSRARWRTPSATGAWRTPTFFRARAAWARRPRRASWPRRSTARRAPRPTPCNECDSCREITAGNSLDVLEIDAASNRGIDQVRELRDMVRYAPAGGRYKVVILDEAHMLTSEASNALLKTLEEPPDKVVFVMATTQPEDLADTIRSRSQHFHFRALSFAEIVEALGAIAKKEGLDAEPGALGVMARAADGSLRDALSLLEQARAYCGTKITEAQVRELLGVVPAEVLDELVAAIETHSAQRALALVHRLLAEGQNLQQFCREAIGHFRNLLVARVCGADSDLVAAPAEERPRLARAAAAFSEEDLTRFFQILLVTEDDLRRKPDPRLHLEMGLLRLVNAARLAPLEEVIAELSGQSAPRPAPARLAEQTAVQTSVPPPCDAFNCSAARRCSRIKPVTIGATAATGDTGSQPIQRHATATDAPLPSRHRARAMAAAGDVVNGDSHSAGGGTCDARTGARHDAERGGERCRFVQRTRCRASGGDQSRSDLSAEISRRIGGSRNAMGTRRRRNSSLLSHREPRAGGVAASARAHGEVAHHHQSCFRSGAARLC